MYNGLSQVYCIQPDQKEESISSIQRVIMTCLNYCDAKPFVFLYNIYIPIHIDTISIGLPIVYFKGPPGKNF